MKDKFDMFNNIEIDFNEYEEIPFNEDEKEKLMYSLNKNIKPKRILYKNLAASIIAVTVISGFIFTNDTVLANINNTSRKLSDYITSTPKGALDDYTKLIGTTIYDKGIGITLNELFMDGNQIIVNTSTDFSNYKINERDNNLYDYTVSSFPNITINNMPTGSGWIDSSTEGTDIINNILSLSYNLNDLDLTNASSKINISIDFNKIAFIENIKGTSDQNKVKNVKGDWKFNFTLDKDTIIKSTKTIVPKYTSLIVNRNIFTIEKVSLSPISVKVFYLTDTDIVPQFKIFDEFGNDLPVKLSSSEKYKSGWFEFRLLEKSDKFTIVPQDCDSSLSQKNSINLNFEK